MAEQSVNGNGERIQKAAENALLTLSSRWITVLMVPATLALGGWMGNYIVGQLNDFIKETRQERESTNNRVNGIDVRLSVTETKVEGLEKHR